MLRKLRPDLNHPAPPPPRLPRCPGQVPRPSSCNCSEQLIVLLAEMLSRDPAARPSAERVVAAADDWLSRPCGDGQDTPDGEGVGLFACSPHHPDREQDME